MYNGEIITKKDIQMTCDENSILVFDNMTDDNIFLLYSLLEMRYKNIYITFMLLCENTITTKKNKNLFEIYKNKKIYLEEISKGKFSVINENIYKKNPKMKMFDRNGNLTNFYKKYSRCIGFNYKKDELVDFNFIKEKLVVDDVLHEGYKIINEKIIVQFKKFIDFVKMLQKGNDKEKEWYNTYYKNLGNIDDLLNASSYENDDDLESKIKRLLYSIKETRDTLYFIEMLETLKNENVIYITTDEISCMRCGLYGLGTLNCYDSVFRYIGIKNKDGYCIKLFNPTYHFVKNLNIDMKDEYKLIVKDYKNIISYNIDNKLPIFMESKKQIGGIDNDILHQDDKIEITEHKDILLDNVNEFSHNFFLVVNNLSNNIHETKRRLNDNDKFYTNLYKQFKKAYDELFVIVQMEEDDMYKFVCPRRIEGLKNKMKRYGNLIEFYHDKKKYKIFDEQKMKMQMILTYYDEINFESFDKTKKLLENFYCDKIKDLCIDLQLVRDIFNFVKDMTQKRQNQIMNEHKDQNGGYIDYDDDKL